MDYRKDSATAVAIKILPKQYYQNNVSAPEKGEWHKVLQEDFVAVEEPLQISLSYYDVSIQAYQTKKLSITMRTPGDDCAMVYGFLLCEGIINTQSDIIECEFDTEEHHGNAVCVILAKHVQPNWQNIERQFTNHSSCGICGKTSLNALQLKAPSESVNNSALKPTEISSEQIFTLPEQLREQQAIFSQTGGLHAAGLYYENSSFNVAEDIGRHNAVDKVIGMHCLAKGDHKETSEGAILVLSGRVSFELVQKAIMANVPMIIAVGAPSALAITAAQKFDITLIGFTKTNSFNVYHGDWRILNDTQ